MTYMMKIYDDEQETVLDLLQGPLRVRGWAWTMPHSALQQKAVSLPFGYQAQSQGYPPVIESIPLVALGCAEDVRDALAGLEILLEKAAAHHDDPIVEKPIWLEIRSEGESGRRTLVTGGSWAATSRIESWPMLDGKQLLLTLALTHHPLWETLTAASDSATGISAVGGMWLWNDTTGRVPARLETVKFSDDNSGFYGYGADHPITTVWAGWRPAYKGTTNFNPIWECESTATGGGMSTFYGAGMSNLIGGTFHNSASAHLVFPDDDLDYRLRILVETVNGGSKVDCKHFAGRYLVLCRTWVNTGTAWLQMTYGYSGSHHTTSGELVVVTNTAPGFKELGTIQIPQPGLWTPTATVDYDAMCAQFGITLWAQGTAGNTIDMDCLILIPSDYFAKVEHGRIWASTDYDTVVYTLPNDRVVGLSETIGTAEIYGSAAVSPLQWYLPTEDSFIVIAAEQDEGQDIDDMLELTVTWRPRWTGYRD